MLRYYKVLIMFLEIQLDILGLVGAAGVGCCFFHYLGNGLLSRQVSVEEIWEVWVPEYFFFGTLLS